MADYRILSRKPFRNTDQIKCVLKQGEACTQELTVLFDYAETRPSTIRAWILGDCKTASRIFDLGFCDSPNHPMILESVDGQYRSDLVYFGQIVFDTQKDIYKVIELALDDLTETYSFDDPTEIDFTSYRFLLSGDLSACHLPLVVSRSYTGTRSVRMAGKKAELLETECFKAYFEPHVLMAVDADDEELELTRTFKSIEVRGPATDSDPYGTSHSEEAAQIADDLTRAMGLYARNPVIWFARDIRCTGFHSHCIRATAHPPGDIIADWMRLVDPSQRDAFLRCAAGGLRKCRTDGIDLAPVCDQLLRASGLTDRRERFIVLFFALEWLREMLSERLKCSEILTEADFKVLQDKIQKLFRKELPSKSERRPISRKLQELNRRSLREQLQLIYSEYNVTLTDLFEEGNDFSFVKIRNGLFHAEPSFDENELFREEHRLRYTLERLILALIGWTGESNTPRSGFEYLVQAQNLE